MDTLSLWQRLCASVASVRRWTLNRQLRSHGLLALVAHRAQEGSLRVQNETDIMGLLTDPPRIDHILEDGLGYCGWTHNDDGLIASSGMYDLNVFGAIKNLTERPDVKVLALQHYNGRQRASMEYQFIGGTRVPKHYTAWYLKFRGDAVIVSITDFNELKGLWHIDVIEEEGGFWNIFQEEVDGYLVRSCRGKIVDLNLQELPVRTYRREDLIYPPNLSQKVDQLFGAFQVWLQDARVARWGALLIGPPGTGKTTVGGLLAGMKTPDCTFLYAPAADLTEPERLVSVFRYAKLLSPAILQIDDVDLISRRRGHYGDSSMTSILMEQLDGLTAETRLFVILTTNDATAIDPAIVNRAGRISNKIVFLGFGGCLPELLMRHCHSLGVTASIEQLQEAVRMIGERANDFTPDEARNTCERLVLSGMSVVSVSQIVNALVVTHEAFHGEGTDVAHLEECPPLRVTVRT